MVTLFYFRLPTRKGAIVFSYAHFGKLRQWMSSFPETPRAASGNRYIILSDLWGFISCESHFCSVNARTTIGMGRPFYFTINHFLPEHRSINCVCTVQRRNIASLIWIALQWLLPTQIINGLPFLAILAAALSSITFQACCMHFKWGPKSIWCFF